MGKSERKEKHRHKSSEEHRREKSKKKRRRSRSSWSSNSNSSAGSESGKFEKHLDELRKEKKRQKKLRKEKLKTEETVEEKRERRLAKRIRKEEKLREKSGNFLPEGVDYTNLNNPFNDLNLTQTFIWSKKLEVEGCSNLPTREIEKINRERTRRNFAEMEELKKNRAAREAAREDLEMIRRDEERRGNYTWEQTEEMFHLNQAKLRSKIRLREGRGKPIDFLARYCVSCYLSQTFFSFSHLPFFTYFSVLQLKYNAECNSRYIQFDEVAKDAKSSDTGGEEYDYELPLVYLRNLSAKDYEDLLEDIKVHFVDNLHLRVGSLHTFLQVYMKIDNGKNLSWWSDISTIVNDELRKIIDDVRTCNLRDSIHGSVQQDVAKILKGKSLAELSQLGKQIENKIHEGREGTDVAYWESLRIRLQVYMAEGRIRERHNEILSHRLAMMKEEQESISHRANSDITKKEFESETDKSGILSQAKTNTGRLLDEIDAADEETKEQRWRFLTDEEMEVLTLEMYERGSYSPMYGDEKEAMPGIEILNEAEDERKRMESRLKHVNHMENSNTSYSVSEKEMLAIAKRDMSSDETSFAVEAPLEAQTFLWSEKYRPRKPRYFNRVHTGFEWNKYNQTHYDMDNPPPKIVQGYRFNIFYPDLLDVTETPSFTVTPCDDPDFAVLRFHSGPPYEDIAFKIVNREWEISHKHGYKCQFANGIFQLWFFFKRYRYRR
uniref:Splicing factor Cactin n=1 Tax=Syphacia muris TaxID=451379 RepID=A0A0N5A9G6_9BILA